MGTCTFIFTGEETVEEIKASLLKKLARLAEKPEKCENYILKLTGRQEYLFGHRKILEFDCVRKCLSKKETLEVFLLLLFFDLFL